MRYRAFGTTGLEVSEIVFGGGAVGGLLIDRDNETRRRAIRRALEVGINWIDTAPSYGQGRSEEALGWLLAEVPERPHVSTKFAVDIGNLGDVAGQIEKSLAESLRRLRLESVPLLQLHNPIGATSHGRVIAADEVLKPGGVLDVLDSLRDQGLVQHFGITALGETPSILRVIESGRVAAAQVYFNLLNPSAGRRLPPSWHVYDFDGILDACERQGVAAMNIRVLSAGVIATDHRTGKERPLTPGDTVESETEKARAVFNALGGKHGTRAQTAIRFALAERRVSCVIVGLAELDHLEEALAAAEMGPLNEESLNEIESIYKGGTTSC